MSSETETSWSDFLSAPEDRPVLVRRDNGLGFALFDKEGDFGCGAWKWRWMFGQAEIVDPPAEWADFPE